MRRSYRYVVLGDIGQWLGLGCLLIAFGFLIADPEHNYELLVMIASIVFTAGTKIKYYGRKRIDGIMQAKRRRMIHLNGGQNIKDRRKVVRT